MSFMLTRMFAYVTLLAYIAMGTVAVRLISNEETTVTFSTSAFSYFTKSEIPQEEIELSPPLISFSELKEEEEKIVKTAGPQKNVREIRITGEEKFIVKKVSKTELNFESPIVLTKLETSIDVMSTSFLANYIDFEFSEVPKIADIKDEISTSLAANSEINEEKIETQEVAIEDLVSEESQHELKTEENIPAKIAGSVTKVNENKEADDIVIFDYSKAKQDIKQQTITTVSAVTSQPETKANWTLTESSKKKKSPKIQQQDMTSHQNALNGFQSKSFVKEEQRFNGRVTIQITGTDLNKTIQESGFEIRSQDDLSEIIQDHNSGEVVFDLELAHQKMTRSVVALKHGYAPTNTDLIIEEGATELALPMIANEKFNTLMAPFESRGPIGAVLVELDSKTEGASLDVPYSQVIHLDENLKETKESNFTYQLFIGVKSGNALLSYKDNNGSITSKIIHIHERELTFESNFFEDVENEKVSMFEEDLLGRERTPLNISTETIRHFATEKSVKKINANTYKTEFEKTLLGARKYLELSHLDESVFVGYRNTSTLEIPSESFMRHVLSKFEDSKLGNRCLVQVNLRKPAMKIDVGSESVGESLVTYTQILDADGKFYDSVSAKSRKVIVVGENQSNESVSKDSKINFKITYDDGSVEYLGSYCSPNTYLVEQL